MEVIQTPKTLSKVGSRAQEVPKKLPRPIVFWSLNEKTAYRRNRVVQTRMNMVIEDIATQRESSRKSIRYEAHKFRQKNFKYYNHPLGTSVETQVTEVNIAPPNWRPRNGEVIKAGNGESSNGYSSDENTAEQDGTAFSPRQRGIITRAKKSAVRFSMKQDLHEIEDDLKVDDLEDSQTESSSCPFSKQHQERNAKKVRSLSAAQYRPEVVESGVKRQHSAFPALRDRENHDNILDKYSEYARDFQRPCTAIPKKSENYFDKSKAAYQLRQDLRKRAKLRKQGVKTTVFTLQDAINLEKENFKKSKDRVCDYIKRLEDIKKAEHVLVNKWTRETIIDELQI